MRISIAFALVSVAACGGVERAPVDPLSRLDLRAAMSTGDVAPVGLALEDRARFVFDRDAGLLRIDGETVTTVIDMASMPNPGPTAPINPPFTDLVAIAPNVFAITALNDGYLLDTQALTLTQHFCYLPGEEQGTPVVASQRTDAIAYDAENDRIYAQPISYDAVGTFVQSQLARYDATTGTDNLWNGVEPTVAATAMMVSATDRDRLILGQGPIVSFATMASSNPVVVEDLSRFGVSSIDGMAIDRAANTLVVVDSVADAVFDIDLAQLDIALD
ncbi:MAG: hypothetical protein ACKV2T_18485 [Kofleriaceae bacterium]